MIFRRRRLDDGGWTLAFGTAGGVLTYWSCSPSGWWCCST
jgi:hypothetical protein